MERRHRKTFYSVSNGVLGLAVGLISYAVVYAHLWLQKFNSVPLSDLAVALSADAAAEKQLMSDIRLVGSVLILVLVPLMALSWYKYLEVCERPEWELKKGIGAGLILLVAGVTVWLVVESIALRASAVGGIAIGAVTTLADAALLAARNDTHPTGGSGDTENYCTRCGTPAEPKDAYCGDCGARL